MEKSPQVGSPRELYENPANLFVAQFIGSPRMNVFPAGAAPGVASPQGATQLGIRPEHITLTAAGGGDVQGTVDVLEYLGADTFVILSCGDAGQITARVDGNTTLKPGDAVGLEMAAAHRHFFDAAGLAVRG